jgi:DinB superfamily
MDLDWSATLAEQLDWHWQHLLRPRMAGLTDAEYLREPVPGCWSLRPRGTSAAPIAVGGGDWVVEFAIPEPDPPPVTTIAWRMAHLIVGVFGGRVAAHFGGPPVSWDTFPYAATAAQALAQLDEGYAAWSAGVRSLDEAALAKPCGPAEGHWADTPMAGLVAHVNREVIHHGAEICLLRDLYRAGAGPA